MNAGEPLQPLKATKYLEELLKTGYAVKGPRNDPDRDAASLRRFLERGKEYTPENWLSDNGYKFVEPSTFTKGHRIAYKLIDDFPDERFNTPYSLVKDGKEIPLYMKTELPKLD
ncbi:MAG: hypothetical protein JSU94_06540 [Phycisphaerales bacterium]|nr:MAG: hypothetical protein JSU94_06540 [Phycisphaerales bacterium]